MSVCFGCELYDPEINDLDKSLNELCLTAAAPTYDRVDKQPNHTTTNFLLF